MPIEIDETAWPIAEIRQMTRAGRPCPYAALPACYVSLRLPADSDEAGRCLERALVTLERENATILVVMPHPQSTDHSGARAHAYQTRCALEQYDLALRSDRPASPERLYRITRRYDRWAQDTRRFIGPRFTVGRHDLMMTAFNPHYPRLHPRHCEAEFFAIIKTSDLRDIHDRRPDISFRIAVEAKCRILAAATAPRCSIDELAAEFPHWLNVLAPLQPFITETYTNAVRIDPSTETARAHHESTLKRAVESSRLIALCRALAERVDPSKAPHLRALVSAEVPATVLCVAAIVFGDTAGMYLPPDLPFCVGTEAVTA